MKQEIEQELNNSKFSWLKNTWVIIVISAIITALIVWPQLINAASLASQLKGKILLQVEQHGEAWYINPANEKRYYMGKPADAFQLMRDLGIGITNNDLWKIPVADANFAGTDSDGDGLLNMIEDSFGTDKNKADTDGDGYNDKAEILNGYSPIQSGSAKLPIDTNFANKHKGKIFLQIQAHGEAWYVNPDNGKRYFLGRPADAFNIMRSLGLGITDSDLAQITTEGAVAEQGDTIEPAQSNSWRVYQEERAALNDRNFDKIEELSYKPSGLTESSCSQMFPDTQSFDECKIAYLNFLSAYYGDQLEENKITIYEDNKQGIIFGELSSETKNTFTQTAVFTAKSSDGQWKSVTTVFGSWSAGDEESARAMAIDSDNDGTTDEEEKCEGAHAYRESCVKTNPNNKDTDGDGWWDGVENAAETNPDDANFYPYK